MATRRPEHSGPPELYYNEDEASRYASNSHIVAIQSEMAERAIELLALPEDKPSFLLDIGCGTGISGDAISATGHYFVGLDISMSMLRIASQDADETCNGDFIHSDMGQGVPFRPGTFDGAISISAIQWLCHANSSNQNPKKRLHHFFQTLYGCLGRGTRAVLQFYPENESQSDLIMAQAQRAGFNGGLVVDYPNSTKARKVYLVLMTGGIAQLPKALTGEEVEEEERTSVDVVGRRNFVTGNRREKKPSKGSKAWVEAKRLRQIKQGRDVRHESKYSGRKRKPKF
ncbi:hypothetical protein WR25_23935 [Diploscapter pachys]|uniref:18S rRNA (guanine(1575)-N(7))-methyltransferase Bud23 C-terminal domain-containing protein n=1 Tax=Diploscapter pachys TaxID=2018661 RepID=A0A2A2J9T7_9BILA|nr:hypothetical protein WR25_23935 [Diploscapter pachys]